MIVHTQSKNNVPDVEHPPPPLPADVSPFPLAQLHILSATVLAESPTEATEAPIPASTTSHRPHERRH